MLDGVGLESADGIHLLKQLKYVVMSRNPLYELSTLNRITSLFLLDISGLQELEFPSLAALTTVNIKILEVSYTDALVKSMRLPEQLKAPVFTQYWSIPRPKLPDFG